MIERLGGVTRLAEAQRDFVENSGPDRFLRALFETARVEYAGEEERLLPALAAVESALAAWPDSAPLYALRGFLNLRCGRLAQAERDLDVAAEAAPRCGPVFLYRALLAAQRGAPRDEVVDLLALARECRQKAFGEADFGWRIYPELASYSLPLPDRVLRPRGRR
ncbi:MAG: hypothetical protein D6731_25085 [Planctomycetota bacterium]|nr:MAG: hypothetical protein D6731_25085 [Planctomycetota bacterium]